MTENAFSGNIGTSLPFTTLARSCNCFDKADRLSRVIRRWFRLPYRVDPHRLFYPLRRCFRWCIIFVYFIYFFFFYLELRHPRDCLTRYVFCKREVHPRFYIYITRTTCARSFNYIKYITSRCFLFFFVFLGKTNISN